MKSDKILFIASQPFFEKRGSPIRLGFDLLSLSELGYKVDFLTLPIGEDREIPNVTIHRAPNPFNAKKISIGPSPLKLFFDTLLFFMALSCAMKNKYAVIHGVEDCGLIALIVGRLFRTSVVFERHSDPASYGNAKGIKGLLVRIYSKVEKFVMRSSDAVICTGPGLVENAIKYGRASRACLIPDIPSSLAEAERDEISGLRSKFVSDANEVLICYVGSFAVYQGIDLLFASIPLVLKKDPKARFVIIGGSEKEIAERKAALKSEGLESRVNFAGFIDPDQLPTYLSSMDILLSPRISGMNTPLKLLDYLKASVAIVATDCEANRLILDSKTAMLTRLTPESFAGGILRLSSDPDLRYRLTEGGKAILASRHNFAFFKDGLRQCYEYVIKMREK